MEDQNYFNFNDKDLDLRSRLLVAYKAYVTREERNEIKIC